MKRATGSRAMHRGNIRRPKPNFYLLARHTGAPEQE
jgi:hypothetical protein